MSEPADAAEVTLQGQEAMHAGRYDDAVRAFAQAVQLAPQVDGLHFQLAAALLWRGLPGHALASLDRCSALRGPWSRPAVELALEIRGQLGLPVHGMMILPAGATPAPRPGFSPATTLPGIASTISRARHGAEPEGAKR